MNENQLKELDCTISWLKCRMTMQTFEEDYIRFAMMEYARKFNVPQPIDCSTCKHRSVSKYVEPCFMCHEFKEYGHYKKKD